MLNLLINLQTSTDNEEFFSQGKIKIHNVFTFFEQTATVASLGW